MCRKLPIKLLGTDEEEFGDLDGFGGDGSGHIEKLGVAGAELLGQRVDKVGRCGIAEFPPQYQPQYVLF